MPPQDLLAGHWVTRALGPPLDAVLDVFHRLDRIRKELHPKQDRPGVLIWLISSKSHDEFLSLLLLLRFGMVQEAGPHLRLMFENFVNSGLIAQDVEHNEERFLDFRFVQTHDLYLRFGLPIPPDITEHFQRVRPMFEKNGRPFKDWSGLNWADKAAKLGPQFHDWYRRIYARNSTFTHSTPEYIYEWQLSYNDPKENDPIILAHAGEIAIGALEVYFW